MINYLQKILVITCLAIVTSSYAQAPFSKATASTSLTDKLVKYDFPKETIGKNGGGYSLAPDQLASPVKKVALVTFFLEDVGMSSDSEMLNFANVWRTSDELAQTHVNGFYKQGIESLIGSFKENGIDLLLPDQYLDTPEKKEYFKNYEVEHTPIKNEKTVGARAGYSSSRDLGAMTYTTTVTKTVDRIKITPSDQEMKPLFFINEPGFSKSYKGAPLAMTFQTIGLYDRKQATSLGFDLVNELGVDAVLAVYIVTNKMSRKKEEYGIRAVSAYMWGPNPVQREDEEGKGLIYSRGIFYGGTRVFFNNPILFQDEKVSPQPSYAGFENIMTSTGNKLARYLINGSRK